MTNIKFPQKTRKKIKVKYVTRYKLIKKTKTFSTFLHWRSFGTSFNGSSPFENGTSKWDVESVLLTLSGKIIKN